MGYRKWFVIYTKPKSEKKVSEDLQKIGVEVFCPLQEEVRQWSDRKVKKTSPLFRSYVFVRLEPKKRRKVFEVPGVIKYLYWLGKPAVVRDEEIDTIKEWLAKEEYSDIEVGNLVNGRELTLQKGVWKGQEAIIEEVGKTNIILRLVSLGCVLKTQVKQVV